MGRGSGVFHWQGHCTAWRCAISEDIGMTWILERQPVAAWEALQAAWKHDLPAVLEGHDPHRYPLRLSSWPAADTALADVLKAVADYYHVSADDLRSKNRQRRFTEPRQIYCYVAKRHTTKSLAQIGAIIQRDPTTVMHSAQTVAARRKVAMSTQRSVAAIEARLR